MTQFQRKPLVNIHQNANKTRLRVGSGQYTIFKRLQIHRHAFLPFYLCPILWVQSRVLLTDSNPRKKQTTNSYISTYINNAHTWGEYFANNLWWRLDYGRTEMERQAYIRHGEGGGATYLVPAATQWLPGSGLMVAAYSTTGNWRGRTQEKLHCLQPK